MTHKLPDFLRGKYQLTGTVTFTAFFSLFFMLVSTPFSRHAWFEFSDTHLMSYSIAFYILAMMVVIVSKWVMYLTRKSFELTYLQYILWCLAEIVLVCFLYIGLTRYGGSHGILEGTDLPFPKMFGGAFLYTFICMAVPYLISAMFFEIVNMNKTIRLMNTRDIVSDDSGPGVRKVTLYDNSGIMKLSVSLDNLYLVESDDNYVIVWYTDSLGDMKKYMIRCRLKTIEESFKGSSLVRCHRGYIVNLDKVNVLRKEKDGWELDMLSEGIPPIPVSKTYSKNVLARFDNNQAVQ